jgi:hypothetical protein
VFRRLVQRPSHATVVAYLALFVALGGSAYAVGKLDGDSIAKRSIPGNRLEKGSVGTKEVKDLLAKDFKKGQLPAGPRGLQGIQGIQGVQGPSGATNVVVRLSSPQAFPGTGAVAPVATCATGERATGGGLISSSTTNGDATVGSHPTAAGGGVAAEGDTPVGWRSVYQASAGNASRVITTYAICAKP